MLSSDVFPQPINRSYVFLHPFTQRHQLMHTCKTGRDTHTDAIKTASELFVTNSFPAFHLFSATTLQAQSQSHFFFSTRSLVYLSLPSQVLWSSFPFFHFCFSFTPPPSPSSCSPPLIFHSAALPLISQSACGLTEMQGSDGGCQSVSTYLFTNIHTCIHLTHRNREVNSNSGAILSF